MGRMGYGFKPKIEWVNAILKFELQMCLLYYAIFSIIVDWLLFL